MKKLSHFGKGAEVAMVDVSAKATTLRQATARGFVRIGGAALAQVRLRKTPKGDPLEIARIAGIAAAKRGQYPIWVHFGNSDFVNKYRLLAENVAQWRASAGRVESIDLRFSRQVVVNPEGEPSSVRPVAAAVRSTGASSHRASSGRSN